MSEYHIVSIELENQDAIVSALSEMGYNPEVPEIAKNLRGYQNDLRSQKAHIILPKAQVSSASNDIGFEKVNGKYILHISEYDQNSNRFDVNQLKQLYAKNRVMTVIKGKSKYSLRSQVKEKDGSIKIRIARLG